MRFFATLVLLCLFPLTSYAFVGGTPIATDSRIKTFVYNENDVYRLLTHYGYQLNVEFGNKEEIETISVGDRTGWQIIPAGQRLFIRAMEDKAHTNMTVVTNRHAYQFDLYSAPPGQQGWDELVYVVRFYYPEDQQLGSMASPPMAAMPASMPMMPPMTAPMQGMGSMGYAAPPQPPAMPAYGSQQPQPPMAGGTNYAYSFTGEQAIVPGQMYDDGRQTYLVFSPSQMVPQVSMVGEGGREQSVATNTQGSMVIVQGVYPQLVLRMGSSHACIFNETMQRRF
jgi:type IV secretion system protein VirB9